MFRFDPFFLSPFFLSLPRRLLQYPKLARRREWQANVFGVVLCKARSTLWPKDESAVADNSQLATTGVPNLLVHNLDLLVDHLASETVDGDVHPIVLFAFDDEIVWKARSIRFVVTRLSYHVN
jgi:hypothetical protein